MSIYDVISSLGGLALFLYGMKMLGMSLEKVSGSFLEKVLKKLTGNVLVGVLFGAVVTAVIQSSGATTVIIIGLVNAGLLNLRGAIGVIMGANIGTTVTAQILRLTDIDSSGASGSLLAFFKPESLAAFAAIIGMLIVFTAKRSKRKNVGEILIGLSILFTGMLTMENGLSVLKDSPEILNLFRSLENPLIGILVGTAVTALMQSSSVSIGILQALSSTGAITFSGAFPVILGSNIGSCVTSMIASAGANKNAKRTAMIHLYFNIIGTILYFVVIYTIVLIFQANGKVPWLWTDPVNKSVIANFHGVFNISVTILFLPFTKVLERLACWTIRGKDGEEEEINTDNLLDSQLLATPAIALLQAQKTIESMEKYAHTNYHEAVKLFERYDPKAAERVKENDNTINLMDESINNYLVNMLADNLTPQDNRQQTFLLHVTSEINRIGDYAYQLAKNAYTIQDEGIDLTDAARKELNVYFEAVDEILSLGVDAYVNMDAAKCVYIREQYLIVESLEENIKARHVQRFKDGKSNMPAGVILLEILNNLSRIGGHCVNIAKYIEKNKTDTIMSVIKEAD